MRYATPNRRRPPRIRGRVAPRRPAASARLLRWLRPRPGSSSPPSAKPAPVPQPPPESARRPGAAARRGRRLPGPTTPPATRIATRSRRGARRSPPPRPPLRNPGNRAGSPGGSPARHPTPLLPGRETRRQRPPVRAAASRLRRRTRQPPATPLSSSRLPQLRDPPPARSALHLHDEVDPRMDLAAYRLGGHAPIGEGQSLEAPESLRRGVGVDGGEASQMAGVEGPQHVQGLRPAHLANDDPVRAEPERRPQELTQADSAVTVGVRRMSLEPDHVPREGEFGSVFDRHHSLVWGNLRRQQVEESGLPRPGPPGHDDVAPPPHGAAQFPDLFGTSRPSGHEIVEGGDGLGETADRHHWPVHGGGGDDGMEAGTVRQTGINRR